VSRHLFLSPHFDDAVGSCGGTIRRLLDRGHSVRILTIFGGDSPGPYSLPARILHEEWKLERPVPVRRIEDFLACRTLGCESSFLLFPDAIYRQDSEGRHLYPTFEALRGAIAAEDGDLAEQIAIDVQGQIDPETNVYCPLGLGAHVDHAIVNDCRRFLLAPVVFYKDFYYDAAVGQGIVVQLTPAEVGAKRTAFSQYQSQISDLFGDRAAMDTYFSTIGKNETFFGWTQLPEFLLSR